MWTFSIWGLSLSQVSGGLEYINQMCEYYWSDRVKGVERVASW